MTDTNQPPQSDITDTLESAISSLMGLRDLTQTMEWQADVNAAKVVEADRIDAERGQQLIEMHGELTARQQRITELENQLINADTELTTLRAHVAALQETIVEMKPAEEEQPAVPETAGYVSPDTGEVAKKKSKK